jgi:hypothetical protein
LYRAEVVSNQDEQQRGRIEVKVPSLFGDAILPHLAVPKDFRGTGLNRGEFYPPNVGDFVYVEFEMGDSRFPVYSGGWFGENELPPDFTHDAENQPNVRGFTTKAGHSIKFDETENEQKVIINTAGGHLFILDDTVDSEGLFLIHKTGSQYQTDNLGNIKILSKDGAYLFINNETGEVSITSQAGSYASVKEGFKVSDETGEHIFTVDNKGIQSNTSKDFLVNSGTFGVSTGGIDLKDTTQTGLVIGNGQIALGGPAAELIDMVIQSIDAFLNAPSLVNTPAGPSSPLLPPAAVQLATIKTLLTTIKGSL